MGRSGGVFDPAGERCEQVMLGIFNAQRCRWHIRGIRGIRRKGAETADTVRVAVTAEAAAKFLSGADGAVMWELLLAVGSLDSVNPANSASMIRPPVQIEDGSSPTPRSMLMRPL